MLGNCGLQRSRLRLLVVVFEARVILWGLVHQCGLIGGGYENEYDLLRRPKMVRR